MTQQVARARTTFISTVNQIDNVSVDWYFEATGSDTTLDFGASSNPNSVIQNFFNETQADSSQLCFFLAAELSRAAMGATTSWTDITAHLDGSNAGSPFRQDDWTLGESVTGSTLPPDACIMCSYRADYGSTPEKGPLAELPTPDDAIDYGAPPTHTGQTRPRARMRGRFYLGPLNSARALGTAGMVSVPGISNTVYPALQHAFAVHNEGLANQFNTVVWSRRDRAVYMPTHLFVSEGFSTVRKRGDVTLNRVHSWVPITG